VGLCAWGGYGSGKTALFCRALRWAAERGYQVLFADWGATLADVKESYTEDSPSPLIPLERAEILLIDDVSAPATPWQAKQLAQVIRNRYNAARPTLYTSNLAPSELQAALLPEVWSRLLETTEFIECTGDDLRVAIGANRR
jgi:DNA replication protein DnaC